VNERALVTGGSNGIGAALCEALWQSGWQVVVVDRAPPRWRPQPGAPPTQHVACDLADRARLDAALGDIAAAGPFDLVVLNAGVSATGRFEKLPVETMLHVVRVNAEAAMVLASALEEKSALRAGASLVFVSSLSYATGYPGAAAYAASKDALAVFARSIRARLKRRGIHVLTVFPGPTRTTHAARHAPTGAPENRRMPPQRLAALILDAVRRRKAVLYPGMAAKIAALVGKLAPRLATRLIRRAILDRLDGETW
jgi:short-subunit dehydrogenase